MSFSNFKSNPRPFLGGADGVGRLLQRGLEAAQLQGGFQGGEDAGKMQPGSAAGSRCGGSHRPSPYQKETLTTFLRKSFLDTLKLEDKEQIIVQPNIPT